MRGKLTKHWKQGLKRLLEDQRKTEYFAHKLLRRIFEENVIIRGLRVSTPDKDKNFTNTVAAVLDLTVLTDRQERNIILKICEKTTDKETKTVFVLRYYCVEAPAILVDNGITEIYVTIDSELEKLIWRTENNYEEI